MHTEQMPSALALIIPALRETEAGQYTCTATYANSEKLYKSVRIETIGRYNAKRNVTVTESAIILTQQSVMKHQSAIPSNHRAP